jgi:hypothetical protein
MHQPIYHRSFILLAILLITLLYVQPWLSTGWLARWWWWLLLLAGWVLANSTSYNHAFINL